MQRSCAFLQIMLKKIMQYCFATGMEISFENPVKNTPEGVVYLLQKVKRSCKYRGIEKQHVFFGGEDVNWFAENFANALLSKGWLVANVNAHDAKKQRENLQASTDRLDLMGIATMLLSCRGNCCPAQSGVYRNLRTLVRHRKKLVKMKTEIRNRIQTVVGRLFPGFLNQKKSGIEPFSRISLYLMKERFSPAQIRRRKRSTLIKNFQKLCCKKPEITAIKLQEYATQVLTTPNEYIASLQISLACQVNLYYCLLDNILQLEKEMALLLCQTQGAFLTSIKGIGLILASGVTSELGNPLQQKSAVNLASYSGIIP